MPQLQSEPSGETQREEMPRVWGDPRATGQRRQQAEALIARHIYRHPANSERWSGLALVMNRWVGAPFATNCSASPRTAP